MSNKPFPFSVCKECCATGGGSGSDIVIDAELSETSENPVQNKVIYQKIWGLEDVNEQQYMAINNHKERLDNLEPRYGDTELDVFIIKQQLGKTGMEIDKRNYPYNAVDMASVTESISLTANTVLYAFGSFPDSAGTGLVVQIAGGGINGYTEESVLILDFSSVETVPTVTFNTENGTIKWINGEPPVIEAGNVYMFSFTHVKDADNNVLFNLAVGGEFA